MDRLKERLERDAICRAAIALWLQAGPPAGQLMSRYLPAAEARMRARSSARAALNSCDEFKRSLAAASDRYHRSPTANRTPALAVSRVEPAEPPG